MLRTTVKFNNVPRSYSTADVAAGVDAHVQARLAANGIALLHAYNFVHVPLSQSLMTNIGVAVLNFVDPASASAAMAAMAGRRWRAGCGRIKCKAAHIQGLGQNLLHKAAAPSTHKRKMFNPPLVYDGPLASTFCRPSKRSRRPRPCPHSRCRLRELRRCPHTCWAQRWQPNSVATQEGVASVEIPSPCMAHPSNRPRIGRAATPSN